MLWTASGNNCEGQASYKGSSFQSGKSSLPIHADRSSDFTGDVFSLALNQTISHTIPGVWSADCSSVILTGHLSTYDVTFQVTGTVTIPKCAFSFDNNPTCYPRVVVSNFSNPQVTIPVVVQQSGVNTSVPTPSAFVFDRSVGDLNIQIGPFAAKNFIAKIAIRSGTGPPTDVADNFDLFSRLATYGRIALARSQLAQIDSDPDPDKPVRKETLATTIHILSAMCVKKQYYQQVLQTLQGRTKDLTQASTQVRDLRDVVIANDTMTPDEFDAAIARITSLEAQATPGETAELERIRVDLQDAKDAAVKTGNAIRILRDDYKTLLDRMIAEYQGLIVELAQYVSVGDLAQVANITDADRQNISLKIRPADVLIPNSVLGGVGSQIRAAFGLPSPK